MADSILIKRYPNRRYYAQGKYVSLEEIEKMIEAGGTVEIRDTQTGEDLTRPVLTQIIMDRKPDKMALFPVEMLHFMLRSNDAITGFLRDYFQHSLTYLRYLQQHKRGKKSLADPMHWVKLWLEGIAPKPPTDPSPDSKSGDLGQRLKQLEARLEQLEGNDASS